MIELDKKRIGIISGRFPESKFHSQINHKLYADKHGYTYIHCNFPTRAINPYMNKVFFLKAYVHLFDYLFWIDDDAFFFDFEQDIIQYLPKGDHFFSCCSSPDFKELKTVISSGQFFIKCDEIGAQFLDLVLTTDLNMVKGWWEERHGYFSNGDQDAMVYLIETNNTFEGKVELYNYKCFNSRVENILEYIEPHQPLVLHFTGKPDIKWRNYLLVQEKCNLGFSLVKNEYKEGYLIVNESFSKGFKEKVASKLKQVVRIICKK